MLDAAASDQATGATGVVISAIGGTAGVGKTALALHWAHRVAHRFPDGQLYANLRGFDAGNSRPADPADVLRGFLDALGVHPERLPADIEGLAGAVPVGARRAADARAARQRRRRRAGAAAAARLAASAW